MIFETLVAVYRIKKWVASCFCSRGYRRSTKIIGNGTLKWYTEVPQETILLELLENNNLLRYKIWYPGDLYSKSSDEEYTRMLNTPVKTPWVWIGGDNFDGTNMLSHYLLTGNVIKLELLEKLEPSVKQWTYIDYETLDSVNFPVDGIVIE
jgi:hypothetical protein